MSAAHQRNSPFAGAAMPLRRASGAGSVFRSAGARRRPVEATSHAQTVVPSVLLVEPDESARSILQVALSRDGFEVIAVRTAEEALHSLWSGALPAALVSEAFLPELDGFALCSQLRADEATALLPVILMSRDGEAHLDAAGTQGADDLLPKPIFARDVVSLVRLKTFPVALDGTTHGHTDSLSLAHLLRALLAGVRSGRIELPRSRARLAFRQGRVIDAAYGDFTGSEALVRMLLLAEGEYLVSFGASLARATMSYGLRELLGGAMPRLARWQSLVERSVPMGARLAVDFAQLANALASLPDGVNEVVRLFDGRRTVRDVLLETGLGEVLALEVVTRLYAQGIVVPVAGTEVALPAAHPRATVRLFEPVGPGAPDRAPGLFGNSPPALTDEPVGLESGLDVGADRSAFGSPAADLAAPELAAEEREGLGVEVTRQLDAFNIRKVLEAVERPVDTGRLELRDFVQGARTEPGASLAEAVQNFVEPIQLTDVVHALSTPAYRVAPAAEAPATATAEPAPGRTVARADAYEATFFSDEAVATALPYGAFVTAEAAQPKGRPVDALGILLAVALLSGGAGVVAWRLGDSGSVSEEARTAQVAVPAPAPVAVALAPAPVQVPKSPTVAAAVLKPPEPEGPTLAQGIALYDAGKAADAAKLLLSVIDADPTSVQAWLFLGLARFDARDRAGAEDAAMAALDLDPKSGRAVMLLASIYLDQGERGKAEVELKHYLALEPQGPFADDARELLSGR